MKGSNKHESLKNHVLYLLRGGGAHVHFNEAVENFPAEYRTKLVPELPCRAWDLLEHMRIAQWDILEFSRNLQHQSPELPGRYRPR